jgi:hypothetical protein
MAVLRQHLTWKMAMQGSGIIPELLGGETNLFFLVLVKFDPLGPTEVIL